MKMYSIVTLVLFLTAALSWTGCSNSPKETSDTHNNESTHAVEAHDDHEERGEEYEREVHLSKDQLASLTIKTTKVKKGLFPQLVEVVGKIGFNEKRRVDLVARTTGRVEKLHVFAGDQVKRGTLLAELYSPDYLSAQTDLIQAYARVTQNQETEPSAAETALVKAAEEKLIVFGESKSEIQQLLKTTTPKRFLHIHAPFGGTVVASKAVVGRNVEEGDLLLIFADLSTVWVALDIFEKDLSRVSLGSRVTIIPDAYPKQSFTGLITMIGANVEEQTRTIEARAKLKNDKGLLKPGMFVRASMENHVSNGSEGLLVPNAAIVKLDEEKGVFVVEEEGEYRFQPVTISQRSSAWADIQSGLKGEEEVVLEGTFFLKSELSKGDLGEGHAH